MSYSSYRVAALIGYTVMIVVLGAIVSVYSVTWALAFIAIFLLLGIPVMWLVQSRFQRRVEESGGEFPMASGGLGMMARDIAEDRQGDLTEQDREELGEGPPE